MLTQIRVAYRTAIFIAALAWAGDGITAAADDDDKQLEALIAGRALLDEHKPAQAISQHFDRVIRFYEARHAKSKKRIYGARTPEESLMYLEMAAADDDRSGHGRDAEVISSHWGDAYFFKGYCLVELGHPVEARKYLDKALELSPMNAAYLSESGHLDQMDKNWEAALARFTRAAEAAETTTPEEARVFEWTRALRGQGFALIELGRIEEAKAMYHKALELDPNDEGSKHELRYIENMQAH